MDRERLTSAARNTLLAGTLATFSWMLNSSQTNPSLPPPCPEVNITLDLPQFSPRQDLKRIDVLLLYVPGGQGGIPNENFLGFLDYSSSTLASRGLRPKIQLLKRKEGLLETVGLGTSEEFIEAGRQIDRLLGKNPQLQIVFYGRSAAISDLETVLADMEERNRDDASRLRRVSAVVSGEPKLPWLSKPNLELDQQGGILALKNHQDVLERGDLLGAGWQLARSSRLSIRGDNCFRFVAGRFGGHDPLLTVDIQRQIDDFLGRRIVNLRR